MSTLNTLTISTAYGDSRSMRIFEPMNVTVWWSSSRKCQQGRGGRSRQIQNEVSSLAVETIVLNKNLRVTPAEEGGAS